MIKRKFKICQIGQGMEGGIEEDRSKARSVSELQRVLPGGSMLSSFRSINQANLISSMGPSSI